MFFTLAGQEAGYTGVCYHAWVLGIKLRPALHAYMLGEHFIDRATCPAILSLLLPIPFFRFVYHWLIWWHSHTDLTTPFSFTRCLGILSLCLKNKLKWPNCESLFVVASIKCHTQASGFYFQISVLERILKNPGDFRMTGDHRFQCEPGVL